MSKSEFSWELTAQESHGKLVLRWNSNAPFRAQQGQIFVYNVRKFPEFPANRDLAFWCWDTDGNDVGNGYKEINTNLVWGTGYYCARGAQASPNGPYQQSFCQLVTDASMGSNISLDK